MNMNRKDTRPVPSATAGSKGRVGNGSGWCAGPSRLGLQRCTFDGGRRIQRPASSSAPRNGRFRVPRVPRRRDTGRGSRGSDAEADEGGDGLRASDAPLAAGSPRPLLQRPGVPKRPEDPKQMAAKRALRVPLAVEAGGPHGSLSLRRLPVVRLATLPHSLRPTDRSELVPGGAASEEPDRAQSRRSPSRRSALDGVAREVDRHEADCAGLSLAALRSTGKVLRGHPRRAGAHPNPDVGRHRRDRARRRHGKQLAWPAIGRLRTDRGGPPSPADSRRPATDPRSTAGRPHPDLGRRSLDELETAHIQGALGALRRYALS